MKPKYTAIIVAVSRSASFHCAAARASSAFCLSLMLSSLVSTSA